MNTKLLALTVFASLLAPMYAEEKPPVISVGYKIQRPPKKGENPGLLFAAWEDGKIVWSGDQKGGGEPFYTAKVDALKVTELLDRCAKVKELSDPKFRMSYFGPDSSYRTVALRLNGTVVELDSWHEGFEENPNLVALPGITPLDGRTREEVLKTAPKDFLRFREIWKDVRDATKALVPEKGEPYAETIPVLKKPVLKKKK